MQLISINIGTERTLQRKDHVEQTGIFKIPTDKPVQVTKLGLDGDVIISKKHHGGPDQAVYIYGMADYEWWAKETSRELAPGTFGENLTIRELESAQFNIGDYMHIGEVTLQVTAPRIPCGTFAARMEDPQWVKKFRAAERPGLYCRVIKEDILKTGVTVAVEKYANATISVLEMFRDYYDQDKSAEMIRRHLNAPIAIRDREALEDELQKRLAQS
ncbi:MAG: MOSC domain-containing protein [Chloroflexota bacterium]